jgi:hypothetical protein
MRGACERDAGVSLTITWRIPEDCPAEGRTHLYINDCPLQELENASSWQTETVLLPRSQIRDGINTVTIAWPRNGTHWRDRLERLIGMLELGRRSVLYPGYGDLHCLRVALTPAGAQDIAGTTCQSTPVGSKT